MLVGLTALARTSVPNPPDLTSYPWFYLRDGEPLAPDEDAAEVVIVGDVMLGRDVADETDPLAEVAPWLRAADLTMGNLECVIAENPAGLASEQSEFLLQAPPAAIDHLRRAGFDVLGLANNHALDLGPSGLGETLSRLEAAGIAALGTGSSATRRVGDVHLALLAFNAVPTPQSDQETNIDQWDPARATEIAAAAERADAVIVSLHWGYEHETRVDPAQREIARALMDAGADLVVGHHPHVAQAFQIRDGRAVAYSLGNFVFDQQQGQTRDGLALRAFFDQRGLRAVQALPVRAGPRPRLMTPEEAAPLLTRVQPRPQRVGFACDGETCRTGEVSDTGMAQGGIFWGGEIDLTGDGVPEQVRRASQQVIIYQDGAEAWRSPSSWRVVDLALGDPNDDGRNEALLAFWRPADEAPRPPGASDPPTEELTSQPFIIGYRSGAYRTLWGGSAVRDPIHEVELGDVDGDGVQELIVLEERGGAQRSVAVWRWHGWGFSLMWRSPPGRYRDLTLQNDLTGRAIISVTVDQQTGRPVNQ